MKTIPVHYQPKKHINGNGELQLDDSELDPVEKQLLAGVAEHLADVMGSAWVLFDLPPGDFDGLDRIVEESFSRLQSEIKRTDYGDEDVMPALKEIVSCSLLFSKLAIDALCNGDYAGFVRLSGKSAGDLASFRTSLNFLNENDCIDSEQMKACLVQHLKAASEKAAQPHRELKERILDEYRKGKYKSKNQAAEKLAPKFGRSVAVVRSWLQGI